MAFRFIRSAGNVTEPATVQLYASGVVHPGGVVEFTRAESTTAQGFVAPAGAATTASTIFGVCLDYAQGASDTLVRVIPFVPGQIWEADCVNAAATVQIGKKQQLYNDTLLNNTSYNQSAYTGFFLVWQITGSTSGSGKVLGEFFRLPISMKSTVAGLSETSH